MEIIIHRVNSIKKLKKIPNNFGVEIDLRTYKSKIILNHEPFKDGDTLENFLRYYNHGTLILNIKDNGIEDKVIKKVMKAKIKSFFLLDVEFPYIFKSIKNKQKNIAIRFSEKEPIESAKLFQNNFKWLWIDTLTKLPLNKNNIKIVKNFKSCVVCPERWNRPDEIEIIKKKMKYFNFKPNAVMTSLKYVKIWLK
tara:strand:+ start:560 stop:1144 length:585 start_codon:yes stop_codon:yes gene_type:complete